MLLDKATQRSPLATEVQMGCLGNYPDAGQQREQANMRCGTMQLCLEFTDTSHLSLHRFHDEVRLELRELSNLNKA